MIAFGLIVLLILIWAVRAWYVSTPSALLPPKLNSDDFTIRRLDTNTIIHFEMDDSLKQAVEK